MYLILHSSSNTIDLDIERFKLYDSGNRQRKDQIPGCVDRL